METLPQTDIFLNDSKPVMRCPNCSKKYFVDTQELKKNPSKYPKFQCHHCSTQFWLPYPEDNSDGELWTLPLKVGNNSTNHHHLFTLNRIYHEPPASKPPRQTTPQITKGEAVSKNTSPLPSKPEEKAIPNKQRPREHQTQLLKKLLSYLFICMSIGCVILIALGVLFPSSRNLVGIGVASLFLSIAMYRFAQSL